MTLTVGSCFSGIGGLDLGLERAGMRVVWQAENDPHSWRVLARHWPQVPNLGDITLINWAEVPRVDLIAAGYPCQPFSVAGRRLGQDDSRHLWPDVYAAVRFLRPRWLCLENVAGHLALGFGRVLGDLAEIGYDAEWDCIPAAAVGAHHRRDRVFVVAYPQRDERRTQPVAVSGSGSPAVAGLDGPHRTVADPYGCGRIGRPGALRPPGVTEPSHRGPHLADSDGPTRGRQGSPVPGARSETTAPPVEPGGRGRALADGPRVFGRGNRPAGEWPAEPDVGRVADGVPARLDRLRALGNAVVPAVAEHIGRMILEAA